METPRGTVPASETHRIFYYPELSLTLRHQRPKT